VVHNVHMDFQAKVRAIQKKTGENQADLARRFKVSQASVSRWLSGKPPEHDHAEIVEREARRLRIVNAKDARNVTSVQLVGYVGAGGSIEFQQGQGPFGVVEMPPREGESPIVAVRVRGDSMSGALEDGWTVYYEERREPPDESHYGKLCVVGLKDGRALIKKLYPGRRPKHFDLHSVNAPPELDQPVEWAARVVWIRPV
jgi:phage repressor protein C with HTH and peptisase S24 domain